MPNPEWLLKRILHWTSGHPYLTQRLCRAALESSATEDLSAEQLIDRLCEDVFFSHRARDRDDNLIFVRERVLRSEVDRARLLDLYLRVRNRQRVPDDETNPLVSSLRLSGITRLESGRLRVRNRFYERAFDAAWVKQNLPDAEVRRQREAYRRGVVRTLTLAGTVTL